MATTFVISPDELDSNFLYPLKRVFKYCKQLQMSVSVADHFNLLQTKTPQAHLTRLEKCLEDINKERISLPIQTHN